jgi:DNA-binding NtrC family response regulator
VEQLVVVCAPSRPPRTTITLARRPIFVGRDPGDDRTLQLPDPEVSRAHARFEPLDDGWAIVDCDSRNGVFVDNERIARSTPVVLRAGCVIRIGACLIVYATNELDDAIPLVPETDGLLGPSIAMQLVRGAIQLAAARNIPVLVRGETGVGKERVAEALHARSGRPGAFVPVNCATISPGIADSELFGHVAGAFTGASTRSEGLFAAAHEGTLFLDEIGELPEPLQAKLLRVLSTGEIRPVGSTAVRRVDVRVIAATHRDLEADIAAGEFRADLLARLAAWTITIPPLRDRREDVPRIAEGVLARFTASPPRLDIAAAEALLLHDWPANVRELEQTLARALVLAAGRDLVELAHLPPVVRRHHAVDECEAELPLELRIDRSRRPTAQELSEVLAHFGGRVTEAATFFGRSRRQLYRWMQDLGVDPASCRHD